MTHSRTSKARTAMGAAPLTPIMAFGAVTGSVANSASHSAQTQTSEREVYEGVVFGYGPVADLLGSDLLWSAPGRCPLPFAATVPSGR